MNFHEEITGAKASAAELSSMETSLKLTTEAQMHGLSAMNNLQLQDESVDSARRTMEANEYTLQKAEKVLRGMTWSGAIYNMFAADPTPVTHAPRALSGTGADAGRAAASGLAGSSGSSRGGMPVEVYSNSRVDGSVLDPMDDVLKGVEQLHGMSKSLGEKIQSNAAKMADTEAALGSNEDAMLQVTLRTAQLTQRNTSSVETLMGTYMFVHRASGRYVSTTDDGDLVMLTSCGDDEAMMDRAALFFMYRKETHLLGALNAKTHKWLGVTWLGEAKVSGERFGRSEEIYVDLSGRPGGLYLLACNWYTGGWVTTPPHAELPVTSMLKPSAGIDYKDGRIMLEAIEWGDTHKHAKGKGKGTRG